MGLSKDPWRILIIMKEQYLNPLLIAFRIVVYGTALSIMIFMVVAVTHYSLISSMEALERDEAAREKCAPYGESVDINTVPLACRSYFE